MDVFSTVGKVATVRGFEDTNYLVRICASGGMNEPIYNNMKLFKVGLHSL